MSTNVNHLQCFRKDLMNELQFLIYTADNDSETASVIIKGETIWTSQKEMARLFDVGVPAISKHLKNIFEEGELEEKVVVSKMEITTKHGAIADKTQTKDVSYYNLDASFQLVTVSIPKKLRDLDSGLLRYFVST